MDHKEIPSDKKQFLCTHCSGKVLVPKDLPPTTAPCPYCGGTITSPAGDGSGGGQTAAPFQDKVQSPPKPSSGPPPVPPPAVEAPLVVRVLLTPDMADDLEFEFEIPRG